MDSNGNVSAGDGLRELAQMILRDNVTSVSLPDYFKFLLEEQLVEPDALARRWARNLPGTLADSSPADLALMLRQMASELDAAPRVE